MPDKDPLKGQESVQLFQEHAARSTQSLPFKMAPSTLYALGVFLGLILFHLAAETLGNGPGFIISQPNLVKKVVFPLEVLPLAQLGAFWFHALISIGLVALEK